MHDCTNEQQTKVYHLPTLGLEITVKDKGGTIAGSLAQRMYGNEEVWNGPSDKELLDEALEAMERLILAHACAGIDVSSPAYLEGVETVLEALGNTF